MAIPDRSPPPASFEHLLADNPRSGSGLRLGILAAALVHLGVFAITWPTLAQSEPELASPPVYRVIQLTKFKKPPIHFERPVPPKRPVNIPDATPNEAEPLTRERSPSPIIDFPEDLVPLDALPPAPDLPRTTEVKAFIDVDPPRVIFRVEPRYTETARRARFEGAVVLSLVIDPEGRVADVTVLRSLPFGLTENAVEAVSQWLFEPCTVDGRPVSVRYNLTVHFRVASAG
ncbi:MAG: TonB family protein [Thermoanaerobaculales bacterium]